MKSTVRAAAAVIGMSMSALAMAALPFGQLDFVQREATVGATEVVDVRVRFTLDPLSAPLVFSSSPLTGFASEDLPVQGYYYDESNQQVTAEFASIDRAYLNTYFSCGDTFSNGCNGAAPRSYSYGFFTASEPGKPAINFFDSFSLQPGESTEYVFAQFTPTGSGAEPGVYRFYETGLTLNFEGSDANGNRLFTDVTLGATCTTQSNDCAFTRTVTAVPEPGAYALMLAGLGLLGGWTRRRSKH